MNMKNKFEVQIIQDCAFQCLQPWVAQGISKAEYAQRVQKIQKDISQAIETIINSLPMMQTIKETVEDIHQRNLQKLDTVLLEAYKRGSLIIRPSFESNLEEDARITKNMLEFCTPSYNKKLEHFKKMHIIIK